MFWKSSLHLLLNKYKNLNSSQNYVKKYWLCWVKE